MTFLTPSLHWEKFELPDAGVRLLRGVFSAQESGALFHALRDAIRWRQDRIRIFGKLRTLPRLQQWHGDSVLVYSWSGRRIRRNVTAESSGT